MIKTTKQQNIFFIRAIVALLALIVILLPVRIWAADGTLDGAKTQYEGINESSTFEGFEGGMAQRLDIGGLNKATQEASYDYANSINNKKFSQFYSDSVTLSMQASKYKKNWMVDYWIDDISDTIVNKAKSITAGCTTDEQKVKKLYIWIAENIYYDYDYYNAFMGNGKPLPVIYVKPDEVLAHKRTVCQGYADLFCAFSRALGIPCKMVEGYVGDTSDANKEFYTGYGITNHAWNAVYYNGAWHNIDATWGSGNIYVNGKFTKGTSNYFYFDISLEKFSKTHIIISSTDDGIYDKPGTPGSFAISSTNNKKITWKKSSFAAYYEILRKLPGGSYSVVGSTSNNYFIDSSAKANTVYYYTVRAVNKNGKSSYNASGLRVPTPPAVTPLNKATALNGGSIKVTWQSVPGAVSYNVYRRTAGGSFTKIGMTKNTYFTDKNTVFSTTYYYTVRAVNSLGLSGDCYKVGASATTCPVATKMYAATATTDKKIKVSWYPSKGAASYNLYRRISGGSWELLVNTSNAYYTDKSCAPLTSYSYMVKPVGANGLIGAGTPSAVYAKSSANVPFMYKAEATTSNSIKVSWFTIPEAVSYNVYRKADNGSYAKIMNTVNGYCYDKNIVKGVRYTYVVKGVRKDGTLTNCESSGVSAIWLMDAPILYSVENQTDGNVKITWGKVTDAKSYAVYRQPKGGSYVKIAEVTGTQYIDTTAPGFTECAYTVKAVSKSGNPGKCNTGKKILTVPPEVQVSSIILYSDGSMAVIINRSINLDKCSLVVEYEDDGNYWYSSFLCSDFSYDGKYTFPFMAELQGKIVKMYYEYIRSDEAGSLRGKVSTMELPD